MFARERANPNVNVAVCAQANFLVCLPGIGLTAVVSSGMAIGLTGRNTFGWFCLDLFLSMVVSESLMMLLGAATLHYFIGIAVAAGIYGMFTPTEYLEVGNAFTTRRFTRTCLLGLTMLRRLEILS